MIFSQASAAVKIPPTPMMGTCPGIADKMPDDFGAAGAERATAQAAGLGINPLRCQVVRGGAGDGRVGGDDAGDVARPNELQDFIQCFKERSGATFTRIGFGDWPRVRVLDLSQCRQDFVERQLVLQLPQVRGCWGTDIHHKEIRVVAQHAEMNSGVILGSLVERGNFDLPRLMPTDASASARASAKS